MSSLQDLSFEELLAQEEEASRIYRRALGGNFFQNEESLQALKNLEPYWHERERRNRIEQDKINERTRQERRAREAKEIQTLRPQNPTVADIPSFFPESDQKVVKEIIGWAVVRADCSSGPVWTVYEFDVYCWKWVTRTHKARRKDAIYYFEGCDSPTQEDIDNDSQKVAKLLEKGENHNE